MSTKGSVLLTSQTKGQHGELRVNQERLKEILNYNPVTGKFFWKEAKGVRAIAGERAGNTSADGHRTIGVDKKQYREGHLAWLYMTGELPGRLRHLNGENWDNSFSNLMEY